MWTRLVTYRQEEVRDVVRDVHCHTHVREVKPVAQAYQRQRYDVMEHQLPEVLARFLQLQHQHQALLSPIACLQEVVCLEV